MVLIASQSGVRKRLNQVFFVSHTLLRDLGDEMFCNIGFGAESLMGNGWMWFVRSQKMFINQRFVKLSYFIKIYRSLNSIAFFQIQTVFSSTISILRFTSIGFARDRHQISLLIISVFKWIEQLQFLLKSSEKLWFSNDFRGNGS